MPRRDPQAFLADMIAAADAVAAMLSGTDFVAYAESLEKRSAVERQLMNAGEAMSQIRRLKPEWLGHFTTPERIIAFRNILVHGYYMILPDVVYDIATVHLPKLREEARSLASHS